MGGELFEDKDPHGEREGAIDTMRFLGHWFSDYRACSMQSRKIWHAGDMRIFIAIGANICQEERIAEC
jgi:hypothetical protein